ncbi:MAG: choice-of-anchor D domain-containing protein [Archangium sp.]|nr:choice-of-anchor D domain-containing protein [Archangium sp.]
MKNLTFFPQQRLLIFLTAALIITGCRDCGTGTNTNKPDIVPTPVGLSFDACPSRDENGMTVMGVFPDRKKVTLNNRGKAGAQLGFVLGGLGADSFKVGSEDGGVPDAIGPLGETEFEIAFAPTKKGDVSASLTIDDQNADTENPVITLSGSGSARPSQPMIETGPEKKDKSGFLLCTADTPLSDCTLEMPDVLMDQSTTLQIKIRNKGCPALKVTALEIDGATNINTNDGFTVDSPAVLPSMDNPFVLSTADGTDETTITVRFTATDDGSGASSQQHIAILTIKSNDPINGDGAVNPARLTLQANAVKPSIYVTPTSCNYTNSMDNCGYAMRTPHKAQFRVTNDGSTPIQISGVRFRSSGTTTSTDQRFSVTQNIQGQMIQPTMNAAIEVTEVDMPLLVSDQLEIVADIPGMGAGSGGTVVVSVISGIKPCLTTDPMDVVDFGDPADEFSAKLVTIRNGMGCGTLIVSSVSARDSIVVMPPFFSLIDPMVPAGLQLAPGGSFQATVQYRRPSTGGQQTGEMRIVTNDTDYGAPQYKLLLLQSNAALDAFPIASLTACPPASLINDPQCVMGAQNAAAFNLSMIMPDEITLSAATSTDDNGVRECRFTLLPQIPMGASMALQNNNMRTMMCQVKLVIPPGVTGLFRVGLDVWDTRGQQSPASSTMTINIYP